MFYPTSTIHSIDKPPQDDVRILRGKKMYCHYYVVMVQMVV